MKEYERIRQNFRGIIDTTLREGFQFSKANFSLEEQKKIFSYLSEIGVDYIELGNPVKKEIQAMVLELAKEKNKGSSKILFHIRNHECDVKKALESNIDGVNIICTTDPERLALMNTTLQEYISRLEKNIFLAQENNLEVRVSVEDLFNQPFNMALEIYNVAEQLQVERIGASDTLGKAMSWKVYKRIKEMRNLFSMDIEVHFHNDLGHAVSNSLIALQAGANWINTSLLGIGERTGITPLSLLLVNLYMLNPEMTSKYNLKLLTKAENYVSQICNIETPINLITNQTNAFFHKAGIHLNALIKFGPHKYELFPPQLIGNKRNLIIKSLISGKTNEQDVEEFNKIYEK